MRGELHAGIQLCGLLRVGGAPGVVYLLPLGIGGLALGLEVGHVGAHLIGNVVLLLRQAPTGVGLLPELGAALTVALGGALDTGHALGHHGLGNHQLGAAVALQAAHAQHFRHFLQVVAVHGVGVPPVGAESRCHIVNLRFLRHGVERDAVGIVDEGEVVQLQAAGNGSGFTGDALLDAAVAGETVDVLGKDFMLRRVEARGGVLGGDGEADGVGHTPAERAGGAFHADGGIVFRVAGCAGALHAEAFHIVHAQGESAQVQPGVQEHGAVPAGEDEAVPVEPARYRGIHAQQAAEQYSTDFRAPQRQSHVSRCPVENGINCKTSSLVCRFLK